MIAAGLAVLLAQTVGREQAVGSATPVANGSRVLGSVLPICLCLLPSCELDILQASPLPGPDLRMAAEVTFPIAESVLHPSVAHTLLLPYSLVPFSSHFPRRPPKTIS